MAVKVHLHANFPYIPEVPNAALGYLKSAVSDTDPVFDFLEEVRVERKTGRKL